MKNVGYKGRDPISHRRYSRATALNRAKRTGKYTYRGTKVRGKVKAGRNWGEDKKIDPESMVTKYSKNSPSFDEGVHQFKESAKAKALTKLK